MSSLIRRMVRLSSRGKRAQKAAINRQFATKIGVRNEKSKDRLARLKRHSVKVSMIPRSHRHSKRSQKWLDDRAAGKPKVVRLVDVSSKPQPRRSSKSAHRKEMEERRYSQRERRPNVQQPVNLSIATGNRHGGPHKHVREIQRTQRQIQRAKGE